jgi:two-component system phosphate regulon response regulator PhoB
MRERREMSKKVLIADPNKSVGAAVGEHLRRAGFAPIVVDAGDQVVNAVKRELPRLIILEAAFNDPSGFEICKLLQKDHATNHLPILMLSEQADDLDRILGLEIGAEDYVRKPYHPRELVLRVRKIVTRYKMLTDVEGRILLDGLRLDRERCEAYLEGERLTFTAMEFKLLYLLAERIGRVQTRERLLKDIWGYDAEINSRTLDVHIRKIRMKLGEYGSMVTTIHGFGYRMIERRSEP